MQDGKVKSLGGQLHAAMLLEGEFLFFKGKVWGIINEGLGNYWEIQPALDFQSNLVIVPGPVDTPSKVTFSTVEILKMHSVQVLVLSISFILQILCCSALLLLASA